MDASRVHQLNKLEKEVRIILAASNRKKFDEEPKNYGNEALFIAAKGQFLSAKGPFYNMVFEVFSAVSEITHTRESLENSQSVQLAELLLTFLAETDMHKLLKSGLVDGPKREAAAREIKKKLNSARSKFEKIDSDAAKSREIQKIVDILCRLCKSNEYSTAHVAYLFFAEKFYKQILNFFHAA